MFYYNNIYIRYNENIHTALVDALVAAINLSPD